MRTIEERNAQRRGDAVHGRVLGGARASLDKNVSTIPAKGKTKIFTARSSRLRTRQRGRTSAGTRTRKNSVFGDENNNRLGEVESGSSRRDVSTIPAKGKTKLSQRDHHGYEPDKEGVRVRERELGRTRSLAMRITTDLGLGEVESGSSRRDVSTIPAKGKTKIFTARSSRL
jgi:hypothetical protein